MDRLGVGYERLKQENPGLVYCAITGYGQDGPYRDRSGHDMNYLGLVGLLGLTGERDGPPVQAAGQIADLGGGALMAAVGILVALREREVSGDGPARRRLDGRRRAVVAGDGGGADARRRRDAGAGRARARGRAGLLPALPVRRRLRDARRAGAEVLAGVLPRGRARGPDRAASRPQRRRDAARGRGDLRGAHARRVDARSPASTTAASSRCSTSTRRSTPSSCARARWWSRSTSPAPSARCGCSASRSSSRARPATRRARPGRRSGQDTRAVLEGLGYSAEEIDGHARGGRGGRAGGRVGPWLVHGMKVFVPDDFPRGGLPDDVEFVGPEGAEFAVPDLVGHGRAARRAARPPRRPGALRGHRLGRAPRAGRRDALQRRRHALARRGAVGRRGDPA